MLKTKYNISIEKDLQDFEQFTLLKQNGITPEAVLTNLIQKYLFDQTPKKQRRQKNKQLSTEAGTFLKQRNLAKLKSFSSGFCILSVYCNLDFYVQIVSNF